MEGASGWVGANRFWGNCWGEGVERLRMVKLFKILELGLMGRGSLRMCRGGLRNCVKFSKRCTEDMICRCYVLLESFFKKCSWIFWGVL